MKGREPADPPPYALPVNRRYTVRSAGIPGFLNMNRYGNQQTHGGSAASARWTGDIQEMHGVPRPRQNRRMDTRARRRDYHIALCGL
jgi:hypothetical protein